MPATLSEIERKILDFMVLYLRTNTYQPSIREIGERFGIKSTKTVSEHLQALADKGYLERDPSRSRGVRILGVDLNPQTVSIPCYDRLPQNASGLETSEAEQFLSLDRRLVGTKGGSFIRARGEELVALGAFDGDQILLEPAGVDELDDGAIVAAFHDGASGYFRFFRNGNGIALSSLGASRAEAEVDEPQRLVLFGRVSGVFRRLDGVATTVSSVAH